MKLVKACGFIRYNAPRLYCQNSKDISIDIYAANMDWCFYGDYWISTLPPEIAKFAPTCMDNNDELYAMHCDSVSRNPIPRITTVVKYQDVLEFFDSVDTITSKLLKLSFIKRRRILGRDISLCDWFQCRLNFTKCGALSIPVVFVAVQPENSMINRQRSKHDFYVMIEWFAHGNIYGQDDIKKDIKFNIHNANSRYRNLDL